MHSGVCLQRMQVLCTYTVACAEFLFERDCYYRFVNSKAFQQYREVTRSGGLEGAMLWQQ